MIPGWLVSAVTFPGVILHEFAHKFFCDRFGVKVREVSYFNMSGGGHVIHDRTEDFNAIFWISTGPLIINSAIAILFASIASSIGSEGGLFLLFLWLALSFGVHAFPSNQDASNVLDASKQILKTGGSFLHYLSFPFVWLIALANLLRFFWVDFIWAILLIGIGFAIVGNGQAVDEFLNEPSSSSTRTGGRYSTNGEYDCTDYHSSKADAIGPSLQDETSLESSKQIMDKLTSDIETLSTKLDSMNVNEYSAKEDIDKYNSGADLLDKKGDEYKVNYDSYQKQLDDYNSKVDAYNYYLEANCNKVK